MMSEAQHCKHLWRVISNWMGDPTIPNGTFSWTEVRCDLCDSVDENGDYVPEEPPERDRAWEKEMRDAEVDDEPGSV